MIIEREKILAVKVGDEIYCMECVTDEELDKAEPDDIIVEGESGYTEEDVLMWCDRNPKHRIV